MTSLLRDALRLAPTKPQDALRMLEDGISQAQSTHDLRSVSMFARHAAAICVGVGLVEKAEAFYETAIAATPQDSYLYLALGDALMERGATERARVELAKCYELAVVEGDVELARLARSRLDA